MFTRSTRVLLKIIFYTGLSMTLLACNDSAQSKSWKQTVKQVSSGIVSIQIDVPISFDGKWNSSSYATGFVVDSKQGIILTNRHVVTPGPVSAKAILINNEEIDLTPLYIDPVHDFGFFKYQPKQIKHIQPYELRLSDIAPYVGQDIRIIGNDAGQKISILDGTISRLDRDAPLYGKGTYNDFNTFYIQAATSSTGGSSGAPVINLEGEVVALNAGSQSKSANSFFVPLSKIKLALSKLQNNQKIQRGSIQTTFISTSYAELKRLGLNDELAAKYRNLFPELKGLLVVKSIIPQSPADELLEVGDILLQGNQKPVAKFTELESLLNKNTNANATLTVLRRGQEHTFEIHVTDLNGITPSSYLKFDGGIFHNLSYQQARHFNKPIKGVYVANSRYLFNQAGVASRSVITEFNGEKVNDINDLHSQLKQIPNGKKVNLRYFDFSTPNTTNYALVEIDRKWFENSLCVQSKELGYWPCEESNAQPHVDSMKELDKQAANTITDKIEDALVKVKFNSPYSIQGRTGNLSRSGTGVIVDARKGWIVAPRSVVISLLGDVKLVFKNKIEIDGKIEYIHPVHNLVLITYSPGELNGVVTSQIKFKHSKFNAGDQVKQVGLNTDGIVEYRHTQVDSTEEMLMRQFKVPQYIDTNIEGTYLVNGNHYIEGVLADTENNVVGLWTRFEQSSYQDNEPESFKVGISIDYVKELMALVENNKPVYSLDINLTKILPVDALQMGLGKEWLDIYTKNNSSSSRLLAIYNVAEQSSNAQIFKRGDILLTINDTPVTDFRQVETLSQQPKAKVTFFSQGEVKEALVETTLLYGQDIDRVIYWSGLYLHSPHRAAQLQGNVGNFGVYVASYLYGSPATRYGVYAMRQITEIDGVPIKNMDDFLIHVKDKQHKDTVIIKTLDFNNTSEVVSLSVDNNYWPFYELKYSNDEWKRINHLVH